MKDATTENHTKKSKTDKVTGEMIKAAQAGYHSPDFTLRSLCEELHYHYGYLSSAFKKRLGVSFCEYVTDLRLSKAAALLNSESTPVSEIAAAVGFRDALYFSKAFKRRYGIPPTEYRERELERKKREKGAHQTETAPDWYSRFYVK